MAHLEKLMKASPTKLQQMKKKDYEDMVTGSLKDITKQLQQLKKLDVLEELSEDVKSMKD